LEPLANPWSAVQILHRPSICLPPSSDCGIIGKAPIARLDIQIILSNLDPTSWSKQYPHVLDIGQPSAPLDTRADESGVDEITSSCLKYLWVVETVVQIVTAKAKIVWLIRDEHGEYIDSRNLF
jgi:hypothetical protein